MEPIRFVLDGRVVVVDGAPTTTTVLDWLRASGATGTKEGCAEGDCGACTIAVLDPGALGGATWRAVNSCLLLLPMLAGREVVTVQGLARDGEPHPVQAAMVDALGSQCGYCTPGFVMSLFEACYRTDLDQDWKRDDQLCGNLCRCTGYRPIRDALRRVGGLRPDDAFRQRLEAPPAEAGGLRYQAEGHLFLAPVGLDEAVAALADHPGARLVCGATDLGLAVTQRHLDFPVLISVERVPELRILDEAPDGFALGAGVPLTDLEAWSTERLPALHRMLRYFGARQIKHRATLGGNLCNASPIGDLAPVLLALDAVARIAGPAGVREVPLASFFTGYRATALGEGELLLSVRVPRPAEGARIGAYKVSRRRELDISAVSAGMRVEVDPAGVVTLARLAFGGVAATPRRATATEAALVGRPWTGETLRAALPSLERDFAPIDDPRGSANFRRLLARNLLIGFFEETGAAPFVALPPGHAGTVVVS